MRILSFPFFLFVNFRSGLEDCIRPYVDTFVERGVTGKRLLMLDAGDLSNLGVWKIGHQEIVLGAVDLLRQTDSSLGRETLQMLFLKLGTKAESLARELELRSNSSAPSGLPAVSVLLRSWSSISVSHSLLNVW
jgi:hypothetical protein